MLPNQDNKLSTESIVRQMPKIEIEIETEEEETSEDIDEMPDAEEMIESEVEA